MKKLYLMLVGLLLSFASSRAGTIEFDFLNSNITGSSTTALMQHQNWPSNWEIIGASGSGVYGMTFRANEGLSFTNATQAYYKTIYLVTEAKAGTVTFTAKASNYSNANSYMELYKVTKDGDDYTVGEKIAGFAPLSEYFENNTDVKEWTVTLEEDQYIAFHGSALYLREYVNEFADAGPTVAVNGTVTNEDGENVVGASVSLGGQETTTAEDGTYSFDAIPEGPANLTVTAPGYQTYTQQVEISESFNGDVQLQFIKSTMNLRAWNASMTEVLTTDFEFNLWDSTGENLVVGPVTKNDAGMYVITVRGNLDPAGYTLTCVHKYYQDYKASVPVTSARYLYLLEGQTVSGTATLTEKTLTLTATVVDEQQMPLSNATVVLTMGDTPYTATYNADNGNYTVSNIKAVTAADNSYQVSCTVPDMKPVESESVVFDGADQTVNFVATAWLPTVFEGTVTRSDDETALEGVSVALYTGTTAVADATATTDAEGSYRIEYDGELPADLSLQFEAEFFESMSVSVAPEREAICTTDVELNPVMYTFTATVADSLEEPVAGATVTADGTPLGKDLRGNFEGKFWAGDFVDGYSVEIVASAPGYFPETYELTFDEQTTVTHNFVLEEKVFTYTATVTDEANQPLDNATVTILAADQTAVTVVNKGQGEYVYTSSYNDLPEGPFSVVVDCKYFEQQTGEFNFIAADGTETYDVADTFQLAGLTYTYTLTVLESETDTPVEGAVVTVVNGTEETVLERDSDGNYVFTAEAAAADGVTYAVEIVAEGYVTATSSFSFEDGSLSETVYMEVASSESGIAGITSDENRDDEAVYNLQGVRVNRRNAAPGIYIVNGKKEVIR